MQELQNERDILQEKMAEQILRISTLQSRLDEQRQRAEELQRAGTSDLNLKVYDLQSQLTATKETLQTREKQMSVLKNHLAQSKVIIDKQETEIALGVSSGGSNSASGSQADNLTEKNRLEKLEADLAVRETEVKKLKDKIRTEMINKLALPDLMETMLADKNEEIDFLKEQLEQKEKQLKFYVSEHAVPVIDGKFCEKLSARTLSDVGSLPDYDDLDCIRKEADSRPVDLLVSVALVNYLKKNVVSNFFSFLTGISEIFR